MSSPSSTSTQNNEASIIHAIKDQTVGAIKEVIGSVIGNTDMELEGKAQNLHGLNEYNCAKSANSEETKPETSSEPSQMSGLKDQAIGSVKETFGSATGNVNTELAGKAQQVHGRNEKEFAKAQKEGLSEPEHYVQGTKTTDHAEGKVEDQSVSTLGALKDKTLGSMKSMVGSVTGNQDMELKGKAQNIHGRNEAEFVKAQKQGLSEPEHFGSGTKDFEHAKGEVVSEEPSKLSGWKDQAVGAVKETFGSVTNNQNMELKGKAQKVHGRNEAEFLKAQKEGLTEPEHFGQNPEPAQGQVEGDKISSLSALKDQAVGSVKEAFGSATGNMNTELAGKAQHVHGRNEKEFAKAQKEGLSEPEHYAHGTKTTDHAQGEVVSEEPSKISAWKDQAIGSVKETFGSATGNMNTELAGKAQQIHGRNEAEFAKAQKEGLSEPEHYVQGTKTTDHAQGEVVSEEPSKISAWKDKAVGSVKETIGSATNNQKMEIEGKAQKIQGSTQCANADENNTTINA